MSKILQENAQTPLLFVDDLWCLPENRDIITSAFGRLEHSQPGYIFHYESAQESPGIYGPQSVLRAIEAIPGLGAIVLDLMFGKTGAWIGLQILEAIRKRYPTLPVFVLTALSDEMEPLERAMELGANEYLVKTPTCEDLELMLRTYVQVTGQDADFAIWGNSRVIREMRARIARFSAAGNEPILVVGASGTGKELVARAVHRQSSLRAGPFVIMNCACAGTDLLDSDLFGHEKGAFTGAHERHIGKIERTDGGVLFLDEISSMPHELQGKLLRVIESGQFERLGGQNTLSSKYRLVCATSVEPETLIRSGRLREDLYYRISALRIEVPSLSVRADDVPILASLFLRRVIARALGSPAGAIRGKEFSGKAMRLLRSYSWPGNVRQLQNVVSSAARLSQGPVIEVDALPEEIRTAAIIGGRARSDGHADPSDSQQTIDPSEWPKKRLLSELRLAVEAKSQIRKYKGAYWKAEFMRLMYPHCKAQNAKGFRDLIKRLTHSPWGDPCIHRDGLLVQLLDDLDPAWRDMVSQRRASLERMSRGTQKRPDRMRGKSELESRSSRGDSRRP